jgi:hypothetical protein
MYTPTVALLATLGAENVTMLPEYEKIHSQLIKAAYGAEPAEESNGEQQIREE